jgi:hypothetical protein
MWIHKREDISSMRCGLLTFNLGKKSIERCAMKKMLSRILCSSLFVGSAMLGMVFLSSSDSHADWYSGNITSIAYGYDGATVVFQMANVTKTSCTCYSPWPTYLCLNSQRATHKSEVATLLAARVAKRAIAVNIDEGTCTAVAIEDRGD